MQFFVFPAHNHFAREISGDLLLKVNTLKKKKKDIALDGSHWISLDFGTLSGP